MQVSPPRPPRSYRLTVQAGALSRRRLRVQVPIGAPLSLGPKLKQCSVRLLIGRLRVQVPLDPPHYAHRAIELRRQPDKLDSPGANPGVRTIGDWCNWQHV